MLSPHARFFCHAHQASMEYVEQTHFRGVHRCPVCVYVAKMKVQLEVARRRRVHYNVHHVFEDVR